MDKNWILLKNETKRRLQKSTWIPLRALIEENNGIGITQVGYIGSTFACGSVAIRPEHREIGDRLSWSDIGIGHNAAPYTYQDGYYSPIDEYEYNDKQPIGVELVFEHPQPVLGGRRWILNPDLVVSLRLIKERDRWVRPEEDFIVVAREKFDANGNHTLIEIKREFLVDYLSARNLSLRISQYHQRVENVSQLDGIAYQNLESFEESRDDGRFSLLVRSIDSIWGGSWSMLRVWRNDVDDDEDAPVLGADTNDNIETESSRGTNRGLYKGVRVEGEFWRDEWMEQSSYSPRVRGDKEIALPHFVVETDGSRLPSEELNDEEVGRWLWFDPAVIRDFLRRRGFELEWFTAETGGLLSTSSYRVHFGINSSDLITVYAEDVARLPAWEQRIWAAYNLAPEGKVSKELLDAQVRSSPAGTKAIEVELFELMAALEAAFNHHTSLPLFTHALEFDEYKRSVLRINSYDQPSLLKLAKELIRAFSDRLNTKSLREISSSPDKSKLGTNKLLESILAEKIGQNEAHRIFSVIAGTYDMRVGDSHPTSSKVADAIALAGIDRSESYLKQGEQLIHNFSSSIYWVGRKLFYE